LRHTIGGVEGVKLVQPAGHAGERAVAAAAALANLASDSDANRDSIVEAGGIAPLLSLLETSSSTKAKERAIGAISQLASRRTIQKEIAKAGGIPLLASVIIASQSNGKQEKGADLGIASKLYALAAFAASQLAKGNRLNQTALADAGAIQPLVAMLGSPNSDMQANAACALGTLAEAHADNQAAIARTGAIAPLTSLVREGAPLVKEMCAGALWAVCDDHAPNKSTVTKLGGVEPLVGLLVSGGTEASLIASVGALASYAPGPGASSSCLGRPKVPSPRPRTPVPSTRCSTTKR
jgi:hypothetical protein